MSGRLGIFDVSPVVECGRHPAKAVIGEVVPVTATVVREGHDLPAAAVLWRGPDPDGTTRTSRRAAATVRMNCVNPGLDRWSADVVPTTQGFWSFQIEAWVDPLADWWHDVGIKLDAGQDAAELANDLEGGARLLTRAARLVPKERRGDVVAAVSRLRAEDRPVRERVALAFEPELTTLLDAHPLREQVTRSPRYTVWVDRRRALFGAWYEFFPRSEGERAADGTPVHGTFRTAARRLPAIAEMGFDVVYLPPIHPIGTTCRKGPNNSLTPGADDPGVPWAIGSPAGGHRTVHPQLGTIEDFRAFRAEAERLGIEVALDFAVQFSPDHPWVKEHPEWFTRRPDGTIAYSENPPKKYQDIYPPNFDNDPEGLYEALRDVLLFWIDTGVRIFRCDNPHTKPLSFWHRIIADVKSGHPDVLFLAEAYAKPGMMFALAKVGFTQSYTYFTWRNFRDELEQYGQEMVERCDWFRPNFWVNTPDILHASLQFGGPAMFHIRAALAATMSPTWGMYSGFELFERTALRPGSEEYLDSEKYQLRPRDWDEAVREGRSMVPYVSRLNAVRRDHPALQQLRTLRFHTTDNDAFLAYSKRDPATGDTVVVVVTLDPFTPQETTVHLDLPELGMGWDDRFEVHDEMADVTYDWGRSNYVRLDPHVAPAHIFSVRRYGW